MVINFDIFIGVTLYDVDLDGVIFYEKYGGSHPSPPLLSPPSPLLSLHAIYPTLFDEFPGILPMFVYQKCLYHHGIDGP